MMKSMEAELQQTKSIADMAKAEAGTASAVVALIGNLARGWADNAAPVVTGVAPVIVASITKTPRATGRFRVTVTGGGTDTGGGANEFTLSVSHGAAATPADYTQGSHATVGAAGKADVALLVDLDQLPVPVTFPVGTPVQFNAVMASTAAGVVPAHGMQIEVQEIFPGT
jgi:hypothetical protein